MLGTKETSNRSAGDTGTRLGDSQPTAAAHRAPLPVARRSAMTERRCIRWAWKKDWSIVLLP
jgi:hypothetical protein